MAPAITYMIPAMQLVCNLVMPDAPGLNVTNTDSGLTVAQSTPQDHSATLPEGYVAYPDIGVAYKVVEDHINWKEARKRCFDEGAQLAVIDTRQKFNYIKGKVSPVELMHVGIHRFDEKWVSVGDGEVVESIPWGQGEPLATGNCVMVNSPFTGLCNRGCEGLKGDYVCELPIPMGTGKARIAIN